MPINKPDHAPVLLKWDIGYRPTTKQWRLNTSLLNDNVFKTFITEELKIYLETNKSGEMTPLIIWDCAKTFLWGRKISFTSARKIEKNAKQQDLENKIKELEFKHEHHASATIRKDLNATRRQLNSLLSEWRAI